MYLDILILGHLSPGPLHGYELKRKVQTTTAFRLHNNTLYPALRRFEEAGAVTKVAEQQEGKPPRHVFTLTELGRELLHDMIAELPPDLADNEAEFLTRLGMFAELSAAERRAVLATRDEALLRQLTHLRLLADLARGSAAHHDWGSVVTGFLIEQIERERALLGGLTARAEQGPS